MSQLRKIIHIDMDAFFASVEQRDNPKLRGKPVVVGGQPDSRGVVAAASYEVRAFGVHSAMPCAQAYRLCNDTIFVRPRFDVYREVSDQVRTIFSDYTDLVEPLSLDEAYLDVSEHAQLKSMASATGILDGSATAIANEIRARIFNELELTSSAGISYNKFLAKIASDINKPNGFFVIKPEDALAFIGRLPVKKINGVGAVTEKKMHTQGIYLGADLRRKSLLELQQLFGKSGQHFHNIARGIDERPVKSARKRKSLGSERTFSEDLVDLNVISARLKELAKGLSRTMLDRGLKIKTITIKLKYSSFVQVTRSKTLDRYVDSLTSLEETFKQLLETTEAGTTPIRLLGLSVSNFDTFEPEQSGEVVGNQMDLAF